jgi:hypothetical protein
MKLYSQLSQIPELQGLPESAMRRVWRDYFHQTASAVGLLGLLLLLVGGGVASCIGSLVIGSAFVSFFAGAVMGGALFHHVVILDIRKRIADGSIKI